MAKGKVEIDIEACKSCLFCIKVCPGKVLDVAKAVNSRGYQYIVAAQPDACTGCTMCALICPDACFTVYR